MRASPFIGARASRARPAPHTAALLTAHRGTPIRVRCLAPLAPCGAWGPRACPAVYRSRLSYPCTAALLFCTWCLALHGTYTLARLAPSLHLAALLSAHRGAPICERCLPPALVPGISCSPSHPPHASGPCTSLCIWTWRLASSPAPHSASGPGALHPAMQTAALLSAHCGALHPAMHTAALLSAHCGAIPHVAPCTTPAPRGSPTPRTAAPIREWCCTRLRLCLHTYCSSHLRLCRCRALPTAALLSRTWCLAPFLHLAALLIRAPRCLTARVSDPCLAPFHRGSPIPRATPCVRYSTAALLFREPRLACAIPYASRLSYSAHRSVPTARAAR